MSDILKEWLQNQWKFCNHSKYQKYFEEWYSNLNQNQLEGFEKNENC